MSRLRWLAALFAGLPLVAGGTAAQAQRTGEDAMRSARDGFGLTLGTESVGIYSTTSARGFSPTQAGNVRIEGLYFDLVGVQGSRVFSGTTMYVGLSAQSYPFPAPTGVADSQFRLPSARPIVSVSLDLETPYGIRSPSASVDISGPVAPGLGFLGGLGLFRSGAQTGGYSSAIAGGALVHFTPADEVQLTGFYTGSRRHGVAAAPLIFTAGAFTPPRIARNKEFGQAWAKNNPWDTNAGAVARVRLSPNWDLLSGVFRSGISNSRNFSIQYRNTQPDGAAILDILREPGTSTLSWSGEARASGAYSLGRMQHLVYLAVRGKDVVRHYGGADRRTFGAARIGVKAAVPEPSFNLGPQTRDEVHQGAAGAAYVGKWSDKAELSFGLQKAYYHRVIAAPSQPARTSDDRPWLYNATAAVSPTKPLIVFGSYTRGLEDSGVAPENAANRGEVMPASLTRQTDAGARYQVSPRLTLVADVFEIAKPYFALNAQNLFARSGVTRHRGFELSLTNRPVSGLTIVGGLVLLQPRVLQSGSTAIGKSPPGRPSRSVKVNAQYGPAAWRGLSVSAAVDHQGPVYYDRLNTLKLPATTRFDVGARYDFKVRGAALSLRGQVVNLANTFRWQAAGDSNRLSPNGSRQYILRLVTDI